MNSHLQSEDLGSAARHSAFGVPMPLVTTSALEVSADQRRLFLPYIGGVGVYRQKCYEVTRAG